jgi:hypothetical protein
VLLLAAGLAAGAPAGGRPAPDGLLIAALAGAVVALLFVRWDDLADLLAPVRG